MTRKTKAIINLKHISDNYSLANQWAPHCKNIAVIKADAYGHGMVRVAQHLEKSVPAFAVAIFDEAITLRNNGITKPILVLQGAQIEREFVLASQENLWLMLHSQKQVDLLCHCCDKQNLEKPIRLWLKIDTGMHRLGFAQKQLQMALTQIEKYALIKEQLVISSHFSCASELNSPETAVQIKHFNQIITSVKLPKDATFSLANSPAIVSHPESNLDWNRPGILLHGLPLFDVQHETDCLLKPAMRFESEIVALRNIAKGETVGYGKTWMATRSSTIATISVGYGDGYPRQAKNGTPVLVKGKRALLAGTVSMDLISVDVTDIPSAKVGDLVELWGENLSANEVAKYANTIGYDLVTSVSRRVPREYLE